jgi:imidazolonepropionase-like amidohydrolase
MIYRTTVTVAVLSMALTSTSMFKALAQVQAPNRSNEPSSIPATTRITALRNVRVIDGTGAPAKENQTLLIDGANIRAVGATGTITIPEGARMLDLSGRTVLPGLVMLHEHVHYGKEHAEPLTSPRLFLAFGVTTIRTAGTDHPYFDLNLKRKIAQGVIPGPEMHVTSQFLNGEGSRHLGDKIVRDADDARRTVRYWAAEGVTSFKVYRHITKAALAVIIDEAHSLNLPVMGHLESVSCREAVELGIDYIEHGFGSCRSDLTSDGGQSGTANVVSREQALIQKLVDSRVVLTITPIDRGRPLTPRELEVLHPGQREKYLTQQEDLRSGTKKVDPRGIHPLVLRFAKAGGRMALGSDPGCCGGYAQIPGFTNHEAVKMLVEAGFNPVEAIRIATLNGATFLGIQERTGSIAAGKEADLLVVRGDPSLSIADIGSVDMVFADGVAYDPNALLSAVKGLVGWQ